MNNKIVTLAGATGHLGEKIARELIAQGAHVRAMVRATSNRSKLEKIGVADFVTGDMMDPGSLNKALGQSSKADAIISCAAGYTGHTKGDTVKTDTEGYRNLADATKGAGISRFVFISILECDKAPFIGMFNPGIKDMSSMIKWIKTGVYKSKNTQLQKQLFSDLPTVEEAVFRYCRDNKLV